MALLITNECNACAACLPECPNEAIFETRSDCEAKGYKLTGEEGGGQLHHATSDTIYVITYERCTECVGHFDQEQCAAVCPVDCCIPDPNHVEDEGTLLKKKDYLDQLGR